MPVKLKIKVTQEEIDKGRACDSKSCAIALSIRDIFPNAAVAPNRIMPFHNLDRSSIYDIILPLKACAFILDFDTAETSAVCTLKFDLKPFEFEVEVPDAVINMINIEEIEPLLVNHPTLELV